MSAVYLTLPTPTLDIIGWEADAAISGTVTLTLPTPALSVAGLTGIATNVFGVPLTLPVPQLAVTGTPGVIGGVQLKLPTPTLHVFGTDTTHLTLPTPTLSVVAETGIVGSVVLSLPVPALSLVANVPFVANVNLTLLPQLAVSGTTGATGSVALMLKAMALAANGYTGVVGNANMVLPVMRLVAGGGEALIGTVTLQLPMLALQATGVQSSGANYSTIVMHTESNALTTYDNYQFNSFAQFNGVYLGANANGIFALTGANDDGVFIDAVVRTGITEFGSSYLKRVDRCYVGYRTDGDLVLRVTTDETGVFDYLLTGTGLAGLHGNIVKMGKGRKARYWQFEIQNKDGSDFELDMIELVPMEVRRRVGDDDG